MGRGGPRFFTGERRRTGSRSPCRPAPPRRDAGEPMRRVDLPLCQIGARVSPHVDLIDIHDERVIDVVDSPRSVMSGPSGLCDCVTRGYAARPMSRQDVNKLCIDDSIFQIDDSTLQIVDSTLQIGDSTLQIDDSRLQIVDLTLLRASSKRRFEASNRRFEVCHCGIRV